MYTDRSEGVRPFFSFCWNRTLNTFCVFCLYCYCCKKGSILYITTNWRDLETIVLPLELFPCVCFVWWRRCICLFTCCFYNVFVILFFFLCKGRIKRSCEPFLSCLYLFILLVLPIRLCFVHTKSRRIEENCLLPNSLFPLFCIYTYCTYPWKRENGENRLTFRERDE